MELESWEFQLLRGKQGKFFDFEESELGFPAFQNRIGTPFKLAFNNESQWQSGNGTTICQALGSRFDSRSGSKHQWKKMSTNIYFVKPSPFTLHS